MAGNVFHDKFESVSDLLINNVLKLRFLRLCHYTISRGHDGLVEKIEQPVFRKSEKDIFINLLAIFFFNYE